MTNKEKYREFYKDHPGICIFCSPWWLDVVAKSNWDVILIEKNNQIIASFPYNYTKGKMGTKIIGMPILTQKLGPYIIYNKDKTSENKKIAYEHEIYNQIISFLPKFDVFNISFDQQYKNWLPFFWSGFNQRTYYSYQLFNIKNHNDIFYNFAKNKKQKIQKTKNTLSLKYDLDADAFYDYFNEVVKERNEQVSFTRQLFKDICMNVYEQKKGRVFYCTDEQNNIHAINLTVWDSKVAYYLIAMRKKIYNTSGGTEFLVYETIKYVSQFVDIFDFEGSMIQSVEESFRYFGASQTEYYNISKTSSKLLKIRNLLKELKC